MIFSEASDDSATDPEDFVSEAVPFSPHAASDIASNEMRMIEIIFFIISTSLYNYITAAGNIPWTT